MYCVGIASHIFRGAVTLCSNLFHGIGDGHRVDVVAGAPPKKKRHDHPSSSGSQQDTTKSYWIRKKLLNLQSVVAYKIAASHEASN